MSPVSNVVTPRSRAAATTASAPAPSTSSPKVAVPRTSSETASPVVPRRTYLITTTSAGGPCARRSSRGRDPSEHVAGQLVLDQLVHRQPEVEQDLVGVLAVLGTRPQLAQLLLVELHGRRNQLEHVSAGV